jgi:hypothetical protein
LDIKWLASSRDDNRCIHNALPLTRIPVAKRQKRAVEIRRLHQLQMLLTHSGNQLLLND